MLFMALGEIKKTAAGWKKYAAAGLVFGALAAPFSVGRAETTPQAAASHIFFSELMEQSTFQKFLTFPDVVLATGAAVRLGYPPHGAVIRRLKESFVLGSADPRGSLSINGQSVPIHPEGGYLAVIPFTTGYFKIQADLVLDGTTYSAANTVWVNDATSAAPEDPVEIDAIVPRADQVLSPGDRLVVLARGSPNAEGSFEIKGLKGSFTLVESSAGGLPGIYQGSAIIPPGADIGKSSVKVTLKGKKHRLSRESAGRVSVLDPATPWIVQITTDMAIIKAGPKLSGDETLGYIAFLPEGVILEAAGQRGDEIKVRLSDTQFGWISDKEVASLPTGTVPNWTTLRGVKVAVDGNDTEVRIPLGGKVPFQVSALPDGSQMDVTLYGVSANVDSMAWPSTGTLIDYIQWSQEGPQTVRLKLFTAPHSWWGYDTRYEGGTLVIELRRPPPLARDAKSPLAGLTIAVDAGHSLDTGAIGPTGLIERDINWVLAEKLADKLSAAGAKTFMVREGGENMPLYERGKKAWRGRADILISVHNNALPDGANPFERNGTEIYYFHPQSFELARAIHAAYGVRIGRQGDNPYQLKDDGLHYENLALTRPPQMPSVLTESAYIMKPEEESLLKKEKFQNACVRAILDGLENFAKLRRPLQPEKSRRSRSNKG